MAKKHLLFDTKLTILNIGLERQPCELDTIIIPRYKRGNWGTVWLPN